MISQIFFKIKLDPLVVLKKGYRIAMIVGVIGFIILCYLFLNHKGDNLFFILEYKNIKSKI